jgi:hypothetical protein
MNLGNRTVSVALSALLFCSSAWSAIRVPFDPEALKAAELKARDAQNEANYPALERAYKRWLEFYPNEPAMQAALYQAMSLAAEKSGDSSKAVDLHSVAISLDSTIDTRVNAAAKSSAQSSAQSSATRGDGKGADKFAAIFGVVMQTAVAIQQQRQVYQQQRLAAQQMQPQPGQPMPGMPPQAYAYPPAPVGAQGYAPPPGAPAPMPGYPDPNAAAAYAPQQQPGAYAPPPQGYAPPPTAYPPPPTGPPQAYAPPPQAYAPPPGYPPPPQGYAQAPPPYYGPPAQPNMYAAPAGYAPPPGTTRGAASAPLKVIYDESRLGTAAYFEPSAGALLAVDGANLTFTSSGGEAPRVIPASDIREVRLNSAVGTAAGAFHIATKKGLYFQFAPPSGSPDDARELIATLRKQLGLEQ